MVTDSPLLTQLRRNQVLLRPLYPSPFSLSLQLKTTGWILWSLRASYPSLRSVFFGARDRFFPFFSPKPPPSAPPRQANKGFFVLRFFPSRWRRSILSFFSRTCINRFSPSLVLLPSKFLFPGPRVDSIACPAFTTELKTLTSFFFPSVQSRTGRFFSSSRGPTVLSPPFPFFFCSEGAESCHTERHAPELPCPSFLPLFPLPSSSLKSGGWPPFPLREGADIIVFFFSL